MLSCEWLESFPGAAANQSLCDASNCRLLQAERKNPKKLLKISRANEQKKSEIYLLVPVRQDLTVNLMPKQFGVKFFCIELDLVNALHKETILVLFRTVKIHLDMSRGMFDHLFE